MTFHDLRDRLIASDPPLARFRLAARATLALAATGGLLFLAYKAGMMPVQACVLGALVSMWDTLSVQNPNPGKRKVDTILAPFPAMATVTLLTFLQAWNTPVGDAGFILVGFFAVWCRRFGPRGMALGNVALFGSLFSLYVNVEPPMLPACYVALALSGVVAFVVRFGLVADDPGWTLRIAFVAFRARARLVARASAGRRQTHHLTQLNLNAVNVDELLAGPALDIPQAERRWLREQLLGAELSVEHHEGKAATFDALQRQIDAASHARRTGLSDGQVTQISNVPPDTGGIKPTTRLAMQVALGSSLAIVAGSLAPPHTWFWAVLTAFIVFNGTASAGEALRKTWARVVGTAIGVGAGFILVDFVRGHPKVEIALSLAGVFLAMYTFRISYGVMTFFVTATVAMVYDLVGRPTGQLLDARLIETIVGAICGGAAATLVFPLRTRDIVEVTTREFTARLRTSLDSSLARLGAEVRDDAGADDALDAARAFDVQFQQLVARLQPLLGQLFKGTWKQDPREILQAAEEIAVCSRTLAYRAIVAQQRDAASDPSLANVRARIDAALDDADATAGLRAALPTVRELCEREEVSDAESQRA
jgi:uncharacterized membrane protein YccC